MPRPSILLLLLLLASSTSCGRRAAVPTAADAAPRPTLDACRLLTFSQAEQAAEIQLRGMRTALDMPSGSDFAKCSYGSPSELGKTVSIELRRFDSAETAIEVQETSKSRLRSLASGEIEDVPGIGDEAFWGDGRLDQLHVRRGDLRIILTLSMGPDEPRKATAVDLVRTALARIDAGSAG